MAAQCNINSKYSAYLKGKYNLATKAQVDSLISSLARHWGIPKRDAENRLCINDRHQRGKVICEVFYYGMGIYNIRYLNPDCPRSDKIVLEIKRFGTDRWEEFIPPSYKKETIEGTVMPQLAGLPGAACGATTGRLRCTGRRLAPPTPLFLRSSRCLRNGVRCFCWRLR